MIVRIIFCFIVLISDTNVAHPQKSQPRLREEDRVRIAEAFVLSDQFGDQLWEGWSQVPFAFLLVTPEYEFLIRHPNPSNDFKRIGYDSLLNSVVYYRPAQFNIHFLATFPAVNGVSTIVVGQPENTGKSSSAWVITLLHEHFHQWQYTRPGYLANVDSLHLSGGDQTGMWMLNYPFPYDSSDVIERLDSLGLRISTVLKFIRIHKITGLDSVIQDYTMTRARLRKSLQVKDYAYLSFQIWQEGMARYTELKIAKMAGKEYQPSFAMTQLSDYITFADLGARLDSMIFNDLQSVGINEKKRNAFYSLGAGEGMVLDLMNQDWRKRYAEKMFFIEKYYNRHEKPMGPH